MGNLMVTFDAEMSHRQPHTLAIPLLDLSKVPAKTLKLWWCRLNLYQWPSELMFSKPDGWDDMKPAEKLECPMATRLWASIKREVPHEELLDYWNREFLPRRAVRRDAR